MGWLDSLRGSVIGLDTAPLIYFIEKHPTYLPILLPFFEAIHRGDFQVVTSTITLTEVLVVPFRTGNQSIAVEYTRVLLNSRNFTVFPVSGEIAVEAARIRALHGYKTPDAIQIATARLNRANVFVTNDTALVSLSGMQTILLDQLRDQP